MERNHDVSALAEAIAGPGLAPLTAPEKVFGFPGMKLQILLDAGWAEFAEDDMKQINNHLKAGSKLFPITTRGAMYMIDFSDTNNIKQTNPTTRKTRNLRLVSDPAAQQSQEQKALVEEQRRLLEQHEREKQQKEVQQKRQILEQQQKDLQQKVLEHRQREQQRQVLEQQRKSADAMMSAPSFGEQSMVEAAKRTTAETKAVAKPHATVKQSSVEQSSVEANALRSSGAETKGAIPKTQSPRMPSPSQSQFAERQAVVAQQIVGQQAVLQRQAEAPHTASQQMEAQQSGEQQQQQQQQQQEQESGHIVAPSSMLPVMRPTTAPMLASSMVSPWSLPPSGNVKGAFRATPPHVAEIDRHVEELLEKRHAQRADSRHGHAKSSSYHKTLFGRFDEASREACWAIAQVMQCCSAAAPHITKAPQSACRPAACTSAEEDFMDYEMHRLPGITREQEQDRLSLREELKEDSSIADALDSI